MVRPLAVVFVPCAVAYSEFRYKIPNGFEVSGVPAVGHSSKFGGGEYSQFGVDFMEAGYRWTPELCALDSDGDGATNGEELGDACCLWSEMEETPLRANPTSPGHADAFTVDDIAALKCADHFSEL
ncbi:hypothetical protein ACHHYP_17258 [Achlya hypogyna]|uniref:Temptin Cys/Cys disulfide domain-containing protein n=1 Tax=Achlya hypogyna TaxID=1202772 RepID=A0A1V9Y4T0_ACHHY|nr:hypothetical protein ACHHYP_17258 [Achlya hypogyna]